MNVSQLETQAAEAAESAVNLVNRTNRQCEDEHRAQTPNERAQIEKAINAARTLKARVNAARSDASQLSELDRMTDGAAMMMSTARGGGGHSLGAQILASDMGKWIIEHRGKFPAGAWTSPASELMATTLDESTGSGGKLVIPQYLPGILPLPTRRLTVANLLAQGTANSNSIIYMKESTFTNAAAPTAEGAAKPESTLVFTSVTEPVQKIAHWLPVTEEMFEDVAGIQSYLDIRLRLGVELTEDDQLLNGSGTPPALTGLMNRAGLATAVARGTDTNADAIMKQIAAIETATNMAVDGIVMNPTNWLTVALSKDANGGYMSGGGPFANTIQPTLWGRPVALTSAIVANTALVGAFGTAAQLFRRGGIRVEATNSHQDFFVKNLVAVRSELREALAVYRESAFGKVTGLT